MNQNTQNQPTGPHVCPSQETLPTCPGPEHRDKNTRGERTHHPQTQQELWAVRGKGACGWLREELPWASTPRIGAGLPKSMPQVPAGSDLPSCRVPPGVTAPSKHFCFSFPLTLHHHSSQDVTHIGL